MERGEARKTERWEGRWREDGERESKGDREMGGKIAWLYPAGKAFSDPAMITERCPSLAWRKFTTAKLTRSNGSSQNREPKRD